MKAMQIIVFLFLFNAFLFIFTSVGVYQLEGSYEPEQGWVSGSSSGSNFIETVLKVTGVGIIGAAITGVVAHFLAGVTGLQTISLSVILGIFVSFFYNTYTVLEELIEAIPYGSTIKLILILTGSMFVLSIIWGVAQMGMGGARSYE